MKTGYQIVHRLTAAELAANGTSLSGGVIEVVDLVGVPTEDVYNTGAAGTSPAKLIDSVGLTSAGLPAFNMVASQSAMLALSSAKVGDWAIRTDLTTDVRFILQATPASTLVNWLQLTDDFTAQNATDLGLANTHRANTSNPHSVTKTQVGLGNVDNIADTSKPVSTVQQTALDTKVDKVTGKALSTNDYTTAEQSKLSGIAASATANATDAQLRDRTTHTGAQAINTVTNLQTSLDAKQDASTAATSAQLAAHTGNVSNPHTVTKAQVGLGSVDNTQDNAKPVSTAQQLALNFKENALNKGTANGYAGLDATGKVPSAQLPAAVAGVASSTPIHNYDPNIDVVAGRTLHLRADEIPIAGSLASWTDVSGAANNATQATQANQPVVALNAINGLSEATFNGSQYLISPASAVGTTYTIFSVLKTAATAFLMGTGGRIVASSANGGFGLAVGGAAQDYALRFYRPGVAWFSGSTTTLPANVYSVVSATLDSVAGQATYYINGNVGETVTGISAPSGAGTFDIGTEINSLSFSRVSPLAEVIVFNSVLSTANRQKIEGYLAWKYGLVSGLSTGHPYKTNRPAVSEISVYANNTAAIAGGLTAGTLYRSGADPDVISVVH